MIRKQETLHFFHTQSLCAIHMTVLRREFCIGVIGDTDVATSTGEYTRKLAACDTTE